MTPIEVRAQLTDALRFDLGGPGEVLGAKGEALGEAHEADRKFKRHGCFSWTN